MEKELTVSLNQQPKSIEVLKIDTWLNGRRIDELLINIEADVKEKPIDRNIRWQLFEILCLLGHWQRAIKALQTSVQLNKNLSAEAQLLRKLITNEIERTSVMAGKREPGWIIEPPKWANGLVTALKLADKIDQEAADVAREKALSSAPEIECNTNLGNFAWLTDSDSRLGPICEIFASGHYCWLPFSDIAKIIMPPPKHLLDLLWRKAEITLIDTTKISAYVHSRYPINGKISDKQLLSRETNWKDYARTTVIGSGQKTWMHEQGDFGILELLNIQFLN